MLVLATQEGVFQASSNQRAVQYVFNASMGASVVLETLINVLLVDHISICLMELVFLVVPTVLHAPIQPSVILANQDIFLLVGHVELQTLLTSFNMTPP